MDPLISSFLSHLEEYPLALFASSPETLALFSQKTSPTPPILIKKTASTTPVIKKAAPASTPLKEAPPQTIAPPVENLHAGTLDLMKKELGHVNWHKGALSDADAKLFKEEWRSPLAKKTVALLAEKEEEIPFFEAVANALTTKMGESCVVALGHQIEMIPQELKLVVTAESVVFGNKKLLPLYRQLPMEKKAFLRNTPLILLSQISLYRDDPAHKRALWNLLCQLLKSS